MMENRDNLDEKHFNDNQNDISSLPLNESSLIDHNRKKFEFGDLESTQKPYDNPIQQQSKEDDADGKVKAELANFRKDNREKTTVTSLFTPTIGKMNESSKASSWTNNLKKYIPESVMHKGQPWHIFDVQSGEYVTASVVTKDNKSLIVAYDYESSNLCLVKFNLTYHDYLVIDCFKNNAHNSTPVNVNMKNSIQIKVYSKTNGQRMTMNSIRCVTVSDDRVFTGDMVGLIKKWTIEDLTMVSQFDFKTSIGITNLIVTPLSRFLIVVDSDASLRKFNLVTHKKDGKCLKLAKNNNASLTALCVSNYDANLSLYIGNNHGNLSKLDIVKWFIVKEFGSASSRGKDITKLVCSKKFLWVCDGFGSVRQYSLANDSDLPNKWKNLFYKPILFATVSLDDKFLAICCKNSLKLISILSSGVIRDWKLAKSDGEFKA